MLVKRYTQKMLDEHIQFLTGLFGSSVVADLLEEAMLILGNEVRLISFEKFMFNRDGYEKIQFKAYVCHLCTFNPKRMVDIPEWVTGDRKTAYKLNLMEQSDCGAFKHAIKHTMPLLKNYLTT